MNTQTKTVLKNKTNKFHNWTEVLELIRLKTKQTIKIKTRFSLTFRKLTLKYNIWLWHTPQVTLLCLTRQKVSSKKTLKWEAMWALNKIRIQDMEWPLPKHRRERRRASNYHQAKVPLPEWWPTQSLKTPTKLQPEIFTNNIRITLIHKEIYLRPTPLWYLWCQMRIISQLLWSMEILDSTFIRKTHKTWFQTLKIRSILSRKRDLQVCRLRIMKV